MTASSGFSACVRCGDGYAAREVTNAQANHPALRSAVELERTAAARDQPVAAPSPERAARLRAQGWTPTNRTRPPCRASASRPPRRQP